MGDTFNVLYDFKGRHYSASVEMIPETDQAPAYYRVKTQNTQFDIMPVTDERNLETCWKVRKPDTDAPREAIDSDLAQRIGEAIEIRDAHFQNSVGSR